MEEEGGGGGGGRIFGLPWPVIIGIAAVAAYFLFFRNSGSANASAGAGSGTTGGGGTVTSGSTTLQKGAVTVTVTQQAPGNPAGRPPKPRPPQPVHRKRRTGGGSPNGGSDTSGEPEDADSTGGNAAPVNNPMPRPPVRQPVAVMSRAHPTPPRGIPAVRTPGAERPDDSFARAGNAATHPNLKPQSQQRRPRRSPPVQQAQPFGNYR